MSEHFDRPWPERRGIETTDYNNGLLLARTSVEHLASEIGPRAATWQRDVLGRQVKVAQSFGWVFSLQGHPWSIFLCEDYVVAGTAAELSERLAVPVIAYDCSDTAGAMAYQYAEAGKLRESFALEDDEIEFSSELRDSNLEPESAFEFVDEFFRERDAYEPGIYPEYFFADGRTVPRLVAGQTLTVGNPGFILVAEGREIRAVPMFDRVDYVSF